MKRYSEMSREELQAEMDKLDAAKRKAEFPSEAEMLERKIRMAESYMLEPESFAPGYYEVEGLPEPFELIYVNGVMAWGRMGPESEASYPISMLKKIESPK